MLCARCGVLGAWHSLAVGVRLPRRMMPLHRYLRRAARGGVVLSRVGPGCGLLRRVRPVGETTASLGLSTVPWVKWGNSTGTRNRHHPHAPPSLAAAILGGHCRWRYRVRRLARIPPRRTDTWDADPEWPGVSIQSVTLSVCRRRVDWKGWVCRVQTIVASYDGLCVDSWTRVWFGTSPQKFP